MRGKLDLVRGRNRGRGRVNPIKFCVVRDDPTPLALSLNREPFKT